MYVFMLLLMVVGLVYQIQYGKPMTVLLEFCLVIVFDQLKSLPCQLLTYWIVIRRLGFFSITEGFNGVWNDHLVHENGTDLSLLNFLRKKVRQFVEIDIVETTILVMTIILCVVIFIELAIDSYIKDLPAFISLFNWINGVLLMFFIIEIILKLFSLGWEFVCEFINTFDSVIVIVSFVFLVMDTRLPILGLLRTLRLLKVIASIKKIHDEKRARQESIKQQKKQSSSMSSYVERVLDFLEK